MQASSLQEEIWQLVHSIPKGRVATYGQIARLAGFPNHARYVGATLKKLPKNSKLPWFRVVNGKGQLSFKVNSGSYKKQKIALEREGVLLINDRLSLALYQWDL